MIVRCISIAWILSLVMACHQNSSDGDPIANVQEVIKEASLQEKVFKGDCQSKPINEIATGLLTLGEASVKSQRIHFRFSGAKVSRETHLYATTDCLGTDALVLEESGDFTIIENSKTTDGATFIDFNYVKVELYIGNQVGVIIANRIGICNLTNWNTNDKKDVTMAADDVSCYNLGVPRKEYNVYRIDNGSTLYFGTQEKANAPQLRPANIKTDFKYLAE